jgi:hypothetical protein
MDFGARIEGMASAERVMIVINRSPVSRRTGF